jgi:hypothetical protein
MELVPAMVDIEYPGPAEADALTSTGGWEVSTVACHELDDQASALLGSVHGVGQCATSVQLDMQVAVLLIADRHDRPRYRATRSQNMQPVRVVHACENVGGSRARRPASRRTGLRFRLCSLSTASWRWRRR